MLVRQIAHNVKPRDALAHFNIIAEAVQQLPRAWLHPGMHLCESYDSTYDRHETVKFNAAAVSIAVQ